MVDLPRTSFHVLLESLGFGPTDVTVEIGSWVGIFSQHLLDNLPNGGPHVMVDPWRHSDEYSDSVNAPQQEQDSRYAEALQRVSRHGSRVTVLRTVSEEAAELFGPGSVSFVYVDGDHCYAAVMRDLRAWWRQVRVGGVMAGHDLNMRGKDL
jgi:hypothetical protein